MTNPPGLAPITLYTIHRVVYSPFYKKEIGKSVRNESTEPKTPSKTAVEACPTAYKGTPRGEVGS